MYSFNAIFYKMDLYIAARKFKVIKEYLKVIVIFKHEDSKSYVSNWNSGLIWLKEILNWYNFHKYLSQDLVLFVDIKSSY